MDEPPANRAFRFGGVTFRITAGVCPFADRPRPGDTYVEPAISVEIRYLEVTSSGVLRHAMFGQLGNRWMR